MEKSCLIVDLDEKGFKSHFQTISKTIMFPLNTICVMGDEAMDALNEESVVSIVIVVSDSKKCKNAIDLLENFKISVGPLPHFQAIICSDPDPFFLSDIDEYGIENVFSEEDWPYSLQQMLMNIESILQDEESSESKIIKINSAIKKGNKENIKKAKDYIGEYDQYDFLAAYTKGSVLNVMGKYEEATEAFKSSHRLNKSFKPTAVALSENLLILGKIDEAIVLLERLNKQNPRSLIRKTQLVAAYIEKGDTEKACQYLKEAIDLEPSNPKILEIKAQLLMDQGNYKEAFLLMDKMSNVGPYFASKLNNLGIRLSNSEKRKSALFIYEKAHKIVRDDLKFKVSLNAALACYKMEDFTLALKYLERSEREFGGPFEKAEKIRKMCKIGLKKKGTDAKKEAPGKKHADEADKSSERKENSGKGNGNGLKPVKTG
ncbi:MAG: hypothetical protein HQK54_06495 [Oligoflexales bacterium]|nr:hypothetical protein [Oligoflexales bacterium]